MATNYLYKAYISHCQKYPHLFRLLTPEEREQVYFEIREDERPIWRYWDEYVTKNLILGRSPVTIQSVRNGLNTVVRHAEIYSIEQMNTRSLLDEKLIELQDERKFSLATRRTYLKNINSYFLWLHKNHYIEENNVAKIERGKDEVREIAPITECQIQRVINHVSTRDHINAIERTRNLLLIELLRFTGARPSEIISMDCHAIYPEGGKWKVAINGRKQKGRIRFYDCPASIQYLFQDYIRLREEADFGGECLFVSATRNTCLTLSGLQALFKKLSRELGFRFNAHGFRRYVATTLDEKGVPIRDIARYLGHLKTSTTERYIERSCVLTRCGADALAHNHRCRLDAQPQLI